ncbi:HBL274Cp [Eremothecium sinecaudum]|uniref:HBL274Cp n=1 Tax=Eremothecium sinecaudum TaxID=45286 RepID=A0A109UW37_9SACH|nr:HBL274Cp [Eremothecium sinecaudum]AMD18628.1 HBL274Cp [Eremothecium sinecaudum]
MSSIIVPLKDFFTKYHIPLEVQERFGLHNEDVKSVAEAVFTRVKHQESEKVRTVRSAECTLIQPSLKKPKLDPEWSFGSQATMSFMEYREGPSIGQTILTSAGSMIHSEETGVSFKDRGSSGSILQSENCTQQEFMLFDSEISMQCIIDSEPVTASRSSSPLEVLD